ncbi:isoleucine--tRNA ligase [Canibacter sp. lx-72]|uniref:isoleucine--tRNA ligase n=1 Tax=Canibacter zhuwentaonis TaxID=2837491 RepID=UPI001BDC4653|nr:isoleucine--tRNA ligase [Canibacter zhuwentaonis]MBT1018485.1 isoleucine--tRNA ligase [Canibacter zhuwentaonis]
MIFPRSNTPVSASAEPISASYNPPEIEEQVLEFWRADNTFRDSIAARENAAEWVFNDGPPFANGLPHYGHLLTGYAKDVFPRFQTMRGKKVERRFGWDTHGLPAELEAMKQLGLTEKQEILDMGIAKFNAKARDSVLQYTREWEEYVTRQARWVDFENDYKTLNIEYMESVIWAFAELYKKGLAYEGQRILPYCWRDQTPLSNHELRMDDDVYQMRQDPSVTVTFKLRGEAAAKLGLAGVKMLAWTTTPWTLPTNFSVAVGPEVAYVVVQAGPNGAADGAVPGQGAYLLAAARLGAYAKELGYEDAAEITTIAEFKGAELERLQYEPLWDTYADAATWGTENAWIVTVADYVTVTDGTGIVHQATAYGEEDMLINAGYGIPVILSVNEAAEFLPVFSDGPLAEIVGVQAFAANRTIINVLKKEGKLLREASYEHSYPHCWRCRTPLMYKAVSSWFVRVTEIKDELIAANESINWVPANVKYGQFGKWLEGARDWSISRNRFWGTPIPVWVSDDPEYPCVEVYGSLAEIESGFGKLPRNESGEVDLHRPYIDELVKPNPNDPTGKSKLRRIEDVLDVWFDSGSMPFAQAHYPFEAKEWFNTHQPADFIVEYIGQTRGWFYVQHVLSTALFGRPAFKNVASHGIVLGRDGNKMSKSLRNYPDVNEVFERDGSDAMRWFLMSSSVIRGGNLVVTENGIRESSRQFLLRLWNTWYFFSLYANADGNSPKQDTSSAHPLDKYILGKLRVVIAETERALENLDTATACAALRNFTEILTNWYVRGSRERFWEGVSGEHGKPENQAAFNTLYTVLETLCRTAAPLAPMMTEHIWRALTAERSVHLANWPEASEFPLDSELLAAMDEIRQITSQALSMRKAQQLRVRLPLQRLTVVSAQADSLRPFAKLLQDELNVRNIEFIQLVDDTAAKYGVRVALTVNARAAGPRLGKRVQEAIRAAKSGDWSETDGVVSAGGIELAAGEYELTLVAADNAVGEQALALTAGGGFVLLDTAITADLEAEGVARDTVRAVQEARKSAGLNVSDRIKLRLTVLAEYASAIVAHEAMIKQETFAVELSVSETAQIAPTAGVTDEPDGYRSVGVTKAIGVKKDPITVAVSVFTEK